MKWLCFKFLYPYPLEEILLFHVKLLIEELKLKENFFFTRNFDQVFSLKLMISCPEEEEPGIVETVKKFHRSHALLKRVKLTKIPFSQGYVEAGGESMVDISNQVFCFSSNTALSMLFEEDRIYSYFNILVRTIILNYCTALCYYEEKEVISFCYRYINHYHTKDEGSSSLFVSNYNDIKEAIESVNLSLIIGHAKNNNIDLGDELFTFFNASLNLRKSVKELSVEGKVNKPLPLAGIMEDPVDMALAMQIHSNHKRMGVFSDDSFMLISLLYQSLLND